MEPADVSNKTGDLQSLTRADLILEIERLHARLGEIGGEAGEGPVSRGLDDVMRYGEVFLSRYRELFDQAPVSIWEEDWSKVKTVIDRMIEDGISDFRTYFEAHGNLIYTMAYEVEVLDFNAATVEIYRAPSKQAFWSMAQDDFLTLGEFDMFLETLVRLAQGETKIVVEGLEQAFDDSKGFIRDTVFLPSPYRGDWGRVIHVVEDISEQRNAEDALRRAERIEALGQLTGGLAHDLNNLLGTIATTLELLCEHLEPGSRAMEFVTDSMDAARGGTAFVRQLLAFGQRHSPQPRVVDIGGVIETNLSMLQRSLGDAITVSVRSSGKPAVARVDPLLLENALLNIAINARDAMPDGGGLVIGTDLVDAGSSTIDGRRDRMVRLSISDSGAGMSPGVMARATEPFFTTKAKEVGSGLWLSMVDNFVKQADGQMTIESKPGAGTTITLEFPHVGDERPVVQVESATQKPVPRGSESILLVDDDPWLRRVSDDFLRAKGCAVTEVASGVAALEQLASDAPFDAILTDIVMPGEVDGRELARRAREHEPGIKVIYLSSYPETVIDHPRDHDRDVPFLHKPIERDEFARFLRPRLDED